MLRHLLVPALLLGSTIALLAQHRPSLTPCIPPQVPDITGQGCHTPTPDEVRRQKELEKARSKQRYDELRHDTDRLLALANELKQEVDQAGDQTLSLAVVKKAEEIEKLAKSVKNKMKGD